ncbi:MAG: FtsW/RodA/SpoVE family cell cycle protein [Microgenomates group bacterium]
MIKKKNSNQKQFVQLQTIPIFLSLIGLAFIFEASALRAINLFSDSLHYLKYQFVWIILGIFLMKLFSLIDYRKLYLLSLILLVSSIFLLIIVLIPGIGADAGGARRWINFGFFNLQPTELAKFSVILYLSSWFIHQEKRRFFSFLTLVGFLVFLIILQPDMGTAIIVFLISLILYYQSGMNLFNLFILLPISAIGFFILIKIAPYRLARLTAFLNPSSDPQGIGYHINQIFISLSHGGFFGQGFGASRQKYLFLPEAHTDSIFAIIAEEFGFLGGLILILLYAMFVYKIYELIKYSPDKLAKLLTVGIFAFFNLQIIINLAGMVGLFPLTGVPLPFLSYGGSNLLISYSLIGILLNIKKRI